MCSNLEVILNSVGHSYVSAQECCKNACRNPPSFKTVFSQKDGRIKGYIRKLKLPCETFKEQSHNCFDLF